MSANLAKVRGEPCVPLFRTFAFRRDGGKRLRSYVLCFPKSKRE